MTQGSTESSIKETNITVRHPPYAYFHLAVTTLSPDGIRQNLAPLDDVTAVSYISSALTQYMGVTGSAISVDILKTEDQSIWLRVPYDDGNAVAAAISQWTTTNKNLTLRIKARGSWLGSLASTESRTETLWSLAK